MLRTILISPDTDLNMKLERALQDARGVTIVRTLERYPNGMELGRVLRAHAPQAVFISIENPTLCTATAAQIEQIMPGMQLIAVGRSCDPETLMAVMRAGIREFLASPFEQTSVTECLRHVMDTLERRPVNVSTTDLTYAFLPSKPGVGTTTIAINALAAAASDESPALLADFDLNCGLTRFALKLNSSYSIVDALKYAPTLDEQLWPQLVCKAGKLDVLHSGILNPDSRVEQMHVQHLLGFARRNYKVVAADLSGNLERYSLEVMHECRRVFLVCTPELSSLHMARERVQYLHRMELGSRVAVVLNRYSRRGDLSPEEVEKIVGAPVATSFPNDYSRVAKAISDGRPVDPKSDFGRQAAAFAATLLDTKVANIEQKRRFIEYFTLTPARSSFESRKSS